MSASVHLRFCGAAGTVTGSCYEITTPTARFLVDCGLFQGHKTIREMNYGSFGFDPARIDFVLLTHAHIDHSGLIPKLYKGGFRGTVFATEPTRDLLGYMLPDTGYIQESEVRHLNWRNRQRGLKTVEPIFTRQDAEDSLELIKPVAMNSWITCAPGVRARFWNAGHILGSASIELEVEDKKDTLRLLFSGDIGPQEKAFHPDPEAPRDLDYLVTETTYGDRERPDITLEQRREELRQIVNDTVRAGGNLVIPAFAVERTQELLFDLDILEQRKEIPELPLFIDSPLATHVTSIFSKYRSEFEGMAESRMPFKGGNVKFVETVEQSKRLADIRSGAIIMAASGMCDAGRIRHHLKQYLWEEKHTVLFAGYQAPGTLGYLLVSGVKRVRIHGEEIEVRARILTIDNYSAHADRSELLSWVKARQPVHGCIFLTHGDNQSRQAFAQSLKSDGIVPARIVLPELDDTYSLHKNAAPTMLETQKRRAVPDEMRPRDWHNEYAEVTLALSKTLRELKSTPERMELLSKFHAILDAYSENVQKRKKS